MLCGADLVRWALLEGPGRSTEAMEQDSVMLKYSQSIARRKMRMSVKRVTRNITLPTTEWAPWTLDPAPADTLISALWDPEKRTLSYHAQTSDLRNCEIISYYFRLLSLCSFFMQWWKTNVAINLQSQESPVGLFNTRSFALFHMGTYYFTLLHVHSLHIPALNLLLWLWVQVQD